MGVFSTNYEKIWEETEKHLRPKDGFKYVLTRIDGEDDTIINFILEKMQNKGYEIIDIKKIVTHEYIVESMIIYK